MNNKAKHFDRVQNILIIFLTVSALFLLSQTALFGNLSSQSPRQLIDKYFGNSASQASSTQSTLSDLATPIQLLYTNDYARFGRTATTVLNSDFEAISPYLFDALSSAFSPQQVGEEDFLSALQNCGIYCDLTVALPIGILQNMFGIENSIKPEHFIRSILLCADGQTATLYLADENGSCTLYATDLKSSAVRQFLNEQSGNGAYLCAQLPEEYNQLSPYTLILSEQPQRNRLSASNPLTDSDYSDLLRAAEFNPHTENRYTESTGTTVIREGNSSLRIDADGTVSYKGGSAESNSVFFVEAQSGKPTEVEIAASVQKLAATLLQDGSGAASLYLSGITGTSSGYFVTLDYVVGGTPLCFSDGSHAFSATITGQSITDFLLHCRTYALTDTTALLLPLQQAFAIAESEFEYAEPMVYYIDTGADTVSPDWIAD